MLIPDNLGERIILAASLAVDLHTSADSEYGDEPLQFGRRPQTGKTGWDQVTDDMPPGVALCSPLISASVS